MIRRITATAIVLMFVSFSATADDMGGGTIEINRESATMSSPAPEAPVTAPPPAFVELQSRAIAAGIGARIGDGTLLVDGQAHAFSLRGLSLGEFGAAEVTALGPVANLERIEDFAGTYVAVEASAAAITGIGTITMRNQHGVVITLESDVQGVNLALAGAAVTITLE